LISFNGFTVVIPLFSIIFTPLYVKRYKTPRDLSRKLNLRPLYVKRYKTPRDLSRKLNLRLGKFLPVPFSSGSRVSQGKLRGKYSLLA